jgi:hypothetical protein
MVIPTIEPQLTAAKFGLVFRDGKFSKALSEVFFFFNHSPAAIK